MSVSYNWYTYCSVSFIYVCIKTVICSYLRISLNYTISRIDSFGRRKYDFRLRIPFCMLSWNVFHTNNIVSNLIVQNSHFSVMEIQICNYDIKCSKSKKLLGWCSSMDPYIWSCTLWVYTKPTLAKSLWPLPLFRSIKSKLWITWQYLIRGNNFLLLASTWVHTRFLVGFVMGIFLVFCVVLWFYGFVFVCLCPVSFVSSIDSVSGLSFLTVTSVFSNGYLYICKVYNISFDIQNVYGSGKICYLQDIMHQNYVVYENIRWGRYIDELVNLRA